MPVGPNSFGQNHSRPGSHPASRGITQRASFPVSPLLYYWSNESDPASSAEKLVLPYSAYHQQSNCHGFYIHKSSWSHTGGRLIPSLFIRDCKVVRLSPRRSAAPSFPRIFQLHSSSTFTTWLRSTSTRFSLWLS